MANRDTYDEGLITKDLVVLRHIDLSKMDRQTMGLVGQALVAYKTQESSLIWFRDGYILNDQPRIFNVVKELLDATLGFAVGRPDTGQILADNLTLKQAEKAISGAKVRLDVDIELADEEAPVDEGATV